MVANRLLNMHFFHSSVNIPEGIRKKKQGPGMWAGVTRRQHYSPEMSLTLFLHMNEGEINVRIPQVLLYFSK
jgi:hypothetical protein